MRNLEIFGGVPISQDDVGGIIFGEDLIVDETKVRRVEELMPVVMEPAICRGNHEIAYWMYNGVYKRQDTEQLVDVPLRYELTYIPPKIIGNEFIKTLGHRHFPEKKSGLQYAEICEVIQGTAHFLFQEPETIGSGVAGVFYMEAVAGDKVVFPPGLDHCTINPSFEPLLFSDVIAFGVNADYSPFKRYQGASYYEISKNGSAIFSPNPNYERVPPIIKLPVIEYPHLNLTRGKPLYQSFLETKGDAWQFLLDPSLCWPAFPELEKAFMHHISS